VLMAVCKSFLKVGKNHTRHTHHQWQTILYCTHGTVLPLSSKISRSLQLNPLACLESVSEEAAGDLGLDRGYDHGKFEASIVQAPPALTAWL
jgi:hypothetical protein